MPKQITIDIDNFYGLENELRSTDRRFFALTKNFKVKRKELRPLPAFASAENTDYNIVQMLYNEDDNKVNGLGTTTAGGSIPEVFEWTGSAWQRKASSAASSGSRNTEVFFYYKSYVYGWKGADKLWRCDVASSFADYQSLSYSKVCQPVHHPKDDSAYFFADNKVYRLDDTTWDGLVLTLPAELQIESACAYGNYLAIGCSSVASSNEISVVYLWDRDSSLATLSENLDFGTGRIRHLANLNNTLFAVMEASNNFYPEIVIRKESGTASIDINRLECDYQSLVSTQTNTWTHGQIVDNKLYFPMAVRRLGDARLGIWELDSNGNLNLYIYNSTYTRINGVFNDGNSWWIAYNTSGNVHKSVALSSISYADAYYESLVIGDGKKKYKLVSAGISTKPLPSSANITLKYRADTNIEGSWTTIFTDTTNNSLYHEAVNIESDGSELPEFREMQVQALSEDGAVITGIHLVLEEINANLNG